MTGRKARRWASVSLASSVSLSSVLFLMAFPGEARADPSGDNRAAAQVLFDRGRDLVEHNRFAEACPQFAESQRLDPGIGTLLWLADCYENTGQSASAWTAFSQAAADAAERQDSREAVARARAAKLEVALARLTIVVSPEAQAAPDLEIRCDGVPVKRPNWGQPVPLDPGAHTITANAAGGRLWWTNVQLTRGSSAETVTVPPFHEPPSGVETEAQRVEVQKPRRDTPAAEEAQPGDDGHTRRAIAVAVAAGGATGLLVGTFFSLKAKSTYDSSSAFCPTNNACFAEGIDARHRAMSMATVATVAMVSGAALLAGAVVLYLTAPKGGTAPLQVAISPSLRGGFIGVNGRW